MAPVRALLCTCLLLMTDTFGGTFGGTATSNGAVSNLTTNSKVNGSMMVRITEEHSTNSSTPKFKPNWLIYGKKINLKKSIKTPNHIKCWKKCESKKKCKFITWIKKNMKCILFSSYNGGKEKKNCISGPFATSSSAPPSPAPFIGNISINGNESMILFPKITEETNGNGVPVRTRSSSEYGSLYRSHYAIDGLVSTISQYFFHSHEENYPWLQIELSAPTEVSSVTIVNRKDCCVQRLKNVEIRAGMNEHVGAANQLLVSNTVCATFQGPASSTDDINLSCHTPIMAKFVTIQLKDQKAILQINEFKINVKCLTSPGFPNNYPNSYYKREDFSVNGRAMEITFQDFDVENENTCSYDSLWLYNGYGAPLTSPHGLCGNSLPPKFTIPTSSAILIFKTDWSVTRRGFWLCYKAVDNCITSPGYPNNYGNNEDHKHSFSLATSEPMEITFHSFDVEAHPTCSYDRLEFYDGNGQLVKSLCGSSLPPKFIIPTSPADIRFITDGSVTKRGFKFCFKEKAGCVIEDNIDYYGGDIPNKHKIVNGLDECINWCGETYGCKYWSFVKSSQRCWLKTSDSGKRGNSDRISGTKNCGTAVAFSRCVGSWCRQSGTSDQFTRCESVRDGGLTCVNPEGGIPGNHGNNDYDSWCQQLLGFGTNSKATYGARDCTAPKGQLFWCAGYDESGYKWCDNYDGSWKDSTLNAPVWRCATEGITSLTCTKCGVKKKETKIVNGETSQEFDWPWMARLSVKYESVSGRATGTCGGSLIADQWILTAAHCFDDFTQDGIEYVFKQVSVILGDHDRTVSDTNEKEFLVSKVIKHDSYSQSPILHDITLLKLSENADTTKYTPVCLPEAESTYVGKMTDVYGWGSLEYLGSFPNILQETKVEIITNQACTDQGYGSITEKQICAYTVGTDSCQGDSGGPLTYNNNGKHEQIGVVSYGAGCASYAGVYTRVTEYLDWIKTNMEDN